MSRTRTVQFTCYRGSLPLQSHGSPPFMLFMLVAVQGWPIEPDCSCLFQGHREVIFGLWGTQRAQ